MVFSIRLTDEERKLADSYAAFHDISLSDAFKAALFEKIEDEYDVRIAQEALDEHEESGRQARDWDDFKAELDL
ncbi:MAG: DUF6290 family protein [Acidobacteriota bacterium]|nr:DUF6290 family protein [Acidobacteriota bacterium]